MHVVEASNYTIKKQKRIENQKMPSTYTKKNGEVISYDCRKYNAESYAKNKEKFSAINMNATTVIYVF